MACISKALIIGGGIGGLSAALALSKLGVQCDVVELADAALGSSLGISGRALEALEELGIYDEVQRTGRQFAPDSTAASLRSADGQWISPGPEFPSWPGSKQTIGVYRPVFLDILAKAAQKLGVDIRRRVTAQTIEDGEGAAVVTFTDGDTRSYDLVVGADGISSQTRKFLFPEIAKPAYAGQMSIRWMAPGPAVQEEAWYVGEVGRLGFYYMPEQNLIYVPVEISLPQPKHMDHDEVFSLLKRLLDSYTAPAIVELRRRLTPDAELIVRPFEWILLPDPWYRGRSILIGDAAHATTAHMGMGGGMALEDGVVLAQCVAAASSLPEALQAFMTRRLPRVRTVVETSVALSRLAQQDAPPSENTALLTSAFKELAQPY